MKDNKDLENLVKALAENGYRKFATNEDDEDLWQKKYSSGAYLNFNVYKKSALISENMVEAEIRFECSNEGQWTKHLLYGISVEQMLSRIKETEDKLLYIFKIYDGSKYACL